MALAGRARPGAMSGTSRRNRNWPESRAHLAACLAQPELRPGWKGYGATWPLNNWPNAPNYWSAVGLRDWSCYLRLKLARKC